MSKRPMDLISLIYTSRARPGLAAADVDAIHRSALTYNPLDGVTGLLVFNGSQFLQLIEGAEAAIDDLVERLVADLRHADFTVRDRRSISRRCFPNWSMRRLDIDPDADRGLAEIRETLGMYFNAPTLDAITQSLAAISTPAADGVD